MFSAFSRNRESFVEKHVAESGKSPLAQATAFGGLAGREEGDGENKRNDGKKERNNGKKRSDGGVRG